MIYGRLIEPNIIKTHESQIEVGFKGRIVLISDLHAGAYIKPAFIKKVVKKINEIENIDAVVIAGDLTYYPQTDLKSLLSPLSKLNFPTLAVLGNHDTGHPGPEIREELIDALGEQGVIVLNNSSSKIENLDIVFLGLGELWDKDAEVSMLENYSTSDNLVVIAHNPDTVYLYEKSIADLTISGHTHGGQIRVPLIYKYFIPSEYDFNQGFYFTNKGKVFVSSGLGQSGLPFRFGIYPSIDVITLI